MIKKIRNSVKAIIIKDQKMLFCCMEEQDTGEPYFCLPGGGQLPGEPFVEALNRECFEELGSIVVVHDLVLVREYLGKNHNLAYKHENAHHIEYMFKCDLLSPPCPEKASEFDFNQIVENPYIWLSLKEMKELNIYPKALRECFDEGLNLICERVYLGDVN